MAIAVTLRVAVVVLLICFFPHVSHAKLMQTCCGLRSYTHQGDTFCFAFIRNSGASTGSLSLSLHITSAEKTAVNFTVTIGSRRDQFGLLFESHGVAIADSFTVVDLPVEAEVERGVMRRKGVEVVTDGGKIIVLASSIGNGSSDAFLVHPLQTYVGVANYDYYSFSTTGSDPISDSVVLIGSCANDIQIQLLLPPRLNGSVVIPEVYTLSGRPGQPLADTPFPLLPLLLRDATHIHNANSDLSQVKVTTTAPVAVLSGHTCGEAPSGTSDCSLVTDHIPPTLTWGYTFFTAPLAERVGELYRVVSTRNIVLNVSCVSPDSNTSSKTQTKLNTGEMFQFNTSTPQYCCFESNGPIAVMQYSGGHSLDDNNPGKTYRELGDPFMILISPVEQYINNVTFTTNLRVNDHFNRGHYISVTVPIQYFNSSMITLDGNNLSGQQWHRIYCSNGEVCGMGTNMPVSRAFHHVAHFNQNAGLHVSVYGWGDRQSYGYSAGQRMDPIGLPIISLSASSYVVNETSGFLEVTIKRTGDLFSTTSVIVATKESTPVQATGDDFELTQMLVRFREAEDEVNVRITVIDDTEDEDTEQFQIVLSRPPNVAVMIGPEVTADVSIIDDDELMIGFAQSSYIIEESAGSLLLTIESNLPILGGYQILVSSRPDTANAMDYMQLNQILSLDSGRRQWQVVLFLRDDNSVENTESLTVHITVLRFIAPLVVEPSSTRIFIADTDMLDVRILPPFLSVPESNTQIELQIATTGVTTIPLKMQLNTHSNTARAPTDYIPVTTNVTFTPNGENVHLVHVNITDDQLFEGSESFIVTLTPLPPNQARVRVVGGNATIRIQDNDIMTVAFQLPNNLFIREEQGSVNLTIVVLGQSEQAFPLRVFTANVTAQAGIDYIPFNQEIVIYPNQSTFSLTIHLLNDKLVESFEVFSVFLQAVPSLSSLVLIRHSPASIVLLNDDMIPVRFSQTAYEVAEEERFLLVQISTLGYNDLVTDVMISSQSGTAVAGKDFIAISEHLTFTNTTTVNITIISDQLAEGSEQFILLLSLPANVPGLASRVMIATPVAMVTIRDVTRTTIQFSSTQYNVSEGGAVNLLLVVTGELNNTITLLLTTMNGSATESDFEPLSSEVVEVFQGTTNITSTLTTLQDTVFERDESFLVQLTVPPNPHQVDAGRVSSTIVTILDDDDVSVTIMPQYLEVSEGDSARLSASITGTFEHDVSVIVSTRINTTNTNDFDSIINGTIVFKPGKTTIPIFVNITDDALIEPSELFQVILSLPNRDVGRVSILNDLSTIVVADNDRGLQQLTCTAKDDMIIHPFPSSPSSSSFTYHGSCEHTLVTSCGLINDFAVSVDFLAANLSLGRVGVRIGMLQKLVVNEDLSVDVQGFGNLTTIADGAKELNDTIIITNSAHATITLTKLGISVMVIYEASNQTKVVVVNMTQYNTSRGEVCGLCGKLSGQLVYSDAVTTVKTGVRESIQMFARSWQVNPGEQILRKQIRECGALANDTVIGEPLFTVPLHTNSSMQHQQFLCYEIYGSSGSIFNLISDRCVSVNAQYTAMNNPEDGNIIAGLGIVAVNNAGQCVGVTVGVANQCVPQVRVGSAEQETVSFSSHGVTVTKRRERVRVSVPNCENVQLVMWIVCEGVSGQQHIRVIVTRGLNLRSTSHGLMGQFWNIPATVQPYQVELKTEIKDNFNESNLFLISLTPPISSVRNFIAEWFHRSWDLTPQGCLYAGSSQGGALSDILGPQDTVIEGRYSQYRVAGLLTTDYTYTRFDRSFCINT